MRPWQAILLLIILIFFAISSGWKVLYVLTYVLLILFVLSWLWARYSLRKLVFRRAATSGRVQVGEICRQHGRAQTRDVARAQYLSAAGTFPARSRDCDQRRSLRTLS